MTTELEKIVVALMVRATAKGVTVSRTKLVKLLYFLDLRSVERGQATVTGIEWEWHYYGPYSSTIESARQSLVSRQKICETSFATPYDSPGQRISLCEGVSADVADQVLGRIDEVLDMYGHLSANAIKDLSYKTGPMKALMETGHRRGAGSALDLDVVPRVGRDERMRKLAAMRRRAAALDRSELGEQSELVADALDPFSESRQAATSTLVGD